MVNGTKAQPEIGSWGSGGVWPEFLSLRSLVSGDSLEEEMRHVIMAQEWFHGFIETRMEIAKKKPDDGLWVEYLSIFIFVVVVFAAVMKAKLGDDISKIGEDAVKAVADKMPK
jgi:hypothetical protein